MYERRLNHPLSDLIAFLFSHFRPGRRFRYPFSANIGLDCLLPGGTDSCTRNGCDWRCGIYSKRETRENESSKCPEGGGGKEGRGGITKATCAAGAGMSFNQT